MKKKSQVITILVILSFIGVNLINFTLTPDLFTRLDQDTAVVFIEADEYGTDIGIGFEVEIWNPNLLPVVIVTGDTKLLDPGVDISFENQSLDFSLSYIVSPAVTTHYIKPGLFNKSLMFILFIPDVNFTSLPHGEYKLSAEIRASLNQVKSLETLIEVNSTGYYYTSERIPFDWGHMRIITSDWSFFFVSIFQVIIFSIGSFIRKRKKTTKTYN